ncbi:VCBS domain-containing protein, partial [Thiotrichales bacterium 19X7-9]|nr:VCBS domain-containing protein [Thiotrichales bacterium 19X7-9]
NAGLTVSDTLTTTDLDLTDTVSVAVTSVVESGDTSGIANATLLGMMSATTGNFIDGTETVDTFSWSFDSGVEAFDYLAAGESLVLTYTLTVTDAPTGATDTQTVVITINGTNDAPVISIEAGDSAAESLTESNAGLTVSDTLTTTDLDLTDTVLVAVTSVVESGDTSGIANATLLAMMSATTGNFIDGAETVDTFSWSFDSGVEAFDYLAAGESLVLTYTLTVTDAPTGATDTQTVVITINGTNDAPVISIEAGDSAAESLTESNAGLTVSDTLTTTDLDLTDTVSVAVTSVVESGDTSGIANATLLGMMSATTGNFIDGAETQDTFSWSFDSGVEAFDYLAAGESLVLTYTLTVTDAPTGATDTQTVVITINGTNDAPVISIEAGDSAAESLTESNAGLTVSDTLTTTDLDLTDTVLVAVSSVVESGDVSGIANATLLGMMNATTGNFIDGAETVDTFSWSFDSGVEAFDYLAAGESLVLTYTLTVTDSESATDTQDVVITINGTNDAPVISIEAGDSAAESITETDLSLSISGTLTITDLDLSDEVNLIINPIVNVIGNLNGQTNAELLAMFSLIRNPILDNAATSMRFNWDFDTGIDAFNYLAEGENLVLIYRIIATDSQGGLNTQDVVISITGTQDDPHISEVYNRIYKPNDGINRVFINQQDSDFLINLKIDQNANLEYELPLLLSLDVRNVYDAERSFGDPYIVDVPKGKSINLLSISTSPGVTINTSVISGEGSFNQKNNNGILSLEFQSNSNAEVGHTVQTSIKIYKDGQLQYELYFTINISEEETDENLVVNELENSIRDLVASNKQEMEKNITKLGSVSVINSGYLAALKESIFSNDKNSKLDKQLDAKTKEITSRYQVEKIKKYLLSLFG